MCKCEIYAFVRNVNVVRNMHTVQNVTVMRNMHFVRNVKTCAKYEDCAKCDVVRIVLLCEICKHFSAKYAQGFCEICRQRIVRNVFLQSLAKCAMTRGKLIQILRQKGVDEKRFLRHAAWIRGKLIQLIHTTMVPEQVKTQKIQAGVQVSRLEDKDVISSIGSALNVILLCCNCT
ncbi:hypothetical protein Tco_0414725 [Tanacetum coccineum]